jgi:putative oxidoreductase
VSKLIVFYCFVGLVAIPKTQIPLLHPMKTQKIIYWVARLVAVVILGQTLFFKFSGAEESVALFTKLGVEPYGRIGSGVIELLACVLLLVNSTAKWGALVAAGVMAGAIASHLFIIGIESAGDGGYLFMLAWIVLICSLYVLWVNRENLIKQVRSFARRS